VVEVVGRRLSADAAGALLDEALRRAGVAAVPEAAESLVFFVAGALCEVAEASHGEVAADRLMRELRPVLDEAWQLERTALAGGLGTTHPPVSGVTRRDSGVQPSGGLSLRDEEADTIPAQADPLAVAYVNAAGLSVQHPPRVGLSDKPPSSRMTVPYLASALVPDGPRTAIVVVDEDPVARDQIAGALRRLGCLVATAESRLEARRLIRRLEPRVLVADIETIAPDFEPLGPTFEELLHCVPQPAVVLVGASAPRERATQVVGSLLKPVQDADVLRMVEPHLDRDARS
jgi:CheY-like chemotaxis protein